MNELYKSYITYTNRCGSSIANSNDFPYYKCQLQEIYLHFTFRFNNFGFKQKLDPFTFVN